MFETDSSVLHLSGFMDNSARWHRFLVFAAGSRVIMGDKGQSVTSDARAFSEFVSNTGHVASSLCAFTRSIVDSG